MSERVLLSLDRDDALELLDAATRYDDRLDKNHPAAEALDAAMRRGPRLDAGLLSDRAEEVTDA